MTCAEGAARPGIASAEEDPNAVDAFSSPPCFLHELDPSYLGYLGGDEVRALLGELLLAPWPEALSGTIRPRSMLQRHLDRLGAGVLGAGGRSGVPARAAEPGAGDAAAKGAEDCLAARLRAALPRVHDDRLHRDMADLLRLLEHEGSYRRDGRDPG